MRKKEKEAASEEVQQLHERFLFIPINISTITPKENELAMQIIIFL
jgi:hypothetical protein